MWLNEHLISDSAIHKHQEFLLKTSPHHVVIDNLFNVNKLDEVAKVLLQSSYWKPQKHTYSALYVNSAQWQNTHIDQRFVQRDVWQRDRLGGKVTNDNLAQEFLLYLRDLEFMTLLSRIFNVLLTDINVKKPEINTNYFRLNPNDFVNQHADDSPGRVACMLLYLNQNWSSNDGGELVFSGINNKPITIAPLYNRCILFNPSSKGSEHWVNTVLSTKPHTYRYNLTSWYWSI